MLVALPTAQAGNNGSSTEVPLGKARVAYSCLNESMVMTRKPVMLDQKSNPDGIVMDCAFEVQWEMSDFLKDLLNKHKVDPKNFRFRVCWSVNTSSESRSFPWIHSTTSDWRYWLAERGSVMLNQMDLMDYWLQGYQQVTPDAMDYWARMGEIVGRKIIPKFMLYGWSKGAICNWPLGRWRSDIVQGVVSVSGCNSKKAYDGTYDKKAKSDGVVPYLFFSSWKDGFLDCSPGDTMTQYHRQLGVQPLTFHTETPCGHHPDRCWPACDYNHTYVQPFWNFVDIAYAYQSCVAVTDQKTCEDYLCTWDADLGLCGEAHPTRFTPSCATFCDLQVVDMCSGLLEDACATSYRILPAEEAQANGMHSRCKFVEGDCVQAEAQFQCFFQDQCGQEAATEPAAATWQTIYA